jgi:hypothetical protein
MKYYKIFPLNSKIKEKITMAKISQTTFSFKELEKKDDLDRLGLVLEYLPDEELMQVLENERKNGRNDYPVRPMWNTMIAGIVFQHQSINSLIRELNRNPLLKEICGFEPLSKVPKDYIFTRFLKKLMIHNDLLEQMFNQLILMLQKELPDFGKDLSGDGKAIQTLAAPNKNNNILKPDGRRDTEADFGVKKYSGIDKNGKPWEQIKSRFGYRAHIIADSKYELPVAFEVTKAALAENKELKILLEKLKIINPEIIERCEHLSLDRGYDDEDLIKNLWDDYRIKPIVDIRNMWKDKDKSRVLPDTNNIVYDYRGTISCYCPMSNEMRDMTFDGFEKDRNTLKYKCPCKSYGISCEGEKKCKYNKGIRIKIDANRRLFIPLPRNTYKWKDKYDSRTSIERLNGRIDEFFGFEKHYYRGLKKIKLRLCLSFITMLSMALGRIKQKELENIRSMVKIA